MLILNRNVLSPLDELLWAIIGLLLTIGGIFVEATLPIPTQLQDWQQLTFYPLGVTVQVAAVLLVGCLGGKNAAAVSQIAYLVLGLSGFQVFSQGGGLYYLREPTFGYLLGFVPGAWICGFLAFRKPPRLESLLFSCLGGLLAIHITGLLYLGGLSLAKLLTDSWGQAAWQYSLQALPGQFILSCAVAVVSFLLRLVLFY